MNYVQSGRDAALAPLAALFAECLTSAIAVGVNTSLHERQPRKINVSAKTAAQTLWTLNEPRRTRPVPTARGRNINGHYFSAGHKFLAWTGGLAGGISFLSSGVLFRTIAAKLKNDSPQASVCRGKTKHHKVWKHFFLFLFKLPSLEQPSRDTKDQKLSFLPDLSVMLQCRCLPASRRSWRCRHLC